MSEKIFCVYIMSNPINSVLYIGITSDLLRRISDHKQKVGSKFASKYNCVKLVYYEQTPDVLSAIGREKEIKGWKRWKKEALIISDNPNWKDLSDDF